MGIGGACPAGLPHWTDELSVFGAIIHPTCACIHVPRCRAGTLLPTPKTDVGENVIGCASDGVSIVRVPGWRKRFSSPGGGLEAVAPDQILRRDRSVLPVVGRTYG